MAAETVCTWGQVEPRARIRSFFLETRRATRQLPVAVDEL